MEGPSSEHLNGENPRGKRHGSRKEAANRHAGMYGLQAAHVFDDEEPGNPSRPDGVAQVLPFLPHSHTASGDALTSPGTPVGRTDREYPPVARYRGMWTRPGGPGTGALTAPEPSGAVRGAKASSSIGRAPVSKTGGWGFDPLLAWHPRVPARRRHPRFSA